LQETFTILNTHSAHHDPEQWVKPDEFIPDRFLDPVSNKLVNLDKVMAFGLGSLFDMKTGLHLQAVNFYGSVLKFKKSQESGYVLEKS